MIQDSLLSTLSQTAKRYGLTAKRSLKHEKVVNIVIGDDGTYKSVEKGEAMVPRSVFAENDKSHARFLVERLQKVLLLVPKYESQHVEFKKLVAAAQVAIPKSKLRAVGRFLEKLRPATQRRIHEDILDLCGKKANPLVAFVIFGRNGNIPCFDKLAEGWWKKEHRNMLHERFASCVRGICQVTGKKQIIPNCSPMPIGRSGAIFSANWTAAEFGGYDGLEASHIGLDAAVDISVAIEHIDGNLLRYKGKESRTSFRIDDTHRILSWFCDPSVDNNDAIAVERSFFGVDLEEWERHLNDASGPRSYIDWIRDQCDPPPSGVEPAVRPDDDSQFCTLLVAKNPGEARLVILEQIFLTIPKLRQNILQWHEDLQLDHEFRRKPGAKRIQRRPLTVKRAMRVLFDNPGKGSTIPSSICRTIHCAFFHGGDIRGQYLHRLNSRIVKAVITKRHFWDLLSLLKLCLIRKGIDVPKTWSHEKAESSPAYAMGSILFLTAYAQHPKSQGRESVVPNKYLAWLATSPARSFFTFGKYFDVYLTRMQRENGGLAWWLLRARGDLMGLAGDLSTSPKPLNATEKAEMLLGFGLMREVLQTQSFVNVFPHLETVKAKARREKKNGKEEN